MVTFPQDIAAPVQAVITDYPVKAQKQALHLRDIIYATAQSDSRIGLLTETLKWNEPSYLTNATKSGTTLRYDWKSQKPDHLGIFVSCQTSLIDEFRTHFNDELDFEGNRAIWISLDTPLPHVILGVCIGKALTYKLNKD